MAARNEQAQVFIDGRSGSIYSLSSRTWKATSEGLAVQIIRSRVCLCAVHAAAGRSPVSMKRVAFYIGVRLLVTRMADGLDIGTHGLCKQNAEMTQVLSAIDTDALRGCTGSKLLERRVNSGSAADMGAGSSSHSSRKMARSVTSVRKATAGICTLARAPQRIAATRRSISLAPVLLSICHVQRHSELPLRSIELVGIHVRYS